MQSRYYYTKQKYLQEAGKSENSKQNKVGNL